MPKTDAHVKVKAKNNLKIHLDYIPPQEGGRPLSPEEIKSRLAEAGVKTGIKEDVLGYVCSSEKPLANMLVAEAIPPGTGEKARLETYFEINPRRKALEQANGSVNFRELGEIAAARTGQKLYRRIPPTTGEPGTDVYGKEIPGLPGRDLKLTIGSGTKRSPDDENLVVADRDGEIIVKNGVVTVNDVHTEEGDIDFSSGNVRFNGNVKIKGSVKAGFSVKADGDVEIFGNVEDAEVTAGNDVVVQGGFAGTGDGKITAGRDVYVKFIENQHIDAGRDIIINGESLHAGLAAGRSILAKSGKGKIVGGKCEAKQSVEGITLGSSATPPTTIIVGIDPKLAERIKNAESELHQARESREKLEQSVVFLYKMRIDNNNTLPPDKQALLDKLEKAKKSLPEKIDMLTQRIEQLNKEQQDIEKATVSADKSVYPNVTIHIGPQLMHVNDTLGPSVFKVSKGNLVRSSK